MNAILYILICIFVIGCAASTTKYAACFGFCVEASHEKDEAPQHVTETIKEVTK